MTHLLDRRHWVFDLDGTLTVAGHDFAAFKLDNGLPPDRPILEATADMAPEEARRVLDRLEAWEAGLASTARPAPGAEPLLRHLARRGCRLGVLTRNTRANALSTLAAAGLAGFFDLSCVLGREEAPPKPHPRGILALLERWAARATDAVMVGDYLFDMEAGRAAGTSTIYLDLHRTLAAGARQDGLADLVVHELGWLVARCGSDSEAPAG